MTVQGLVPVISLHVYGEKSLEETAEKARELDAGGTWVQLNFNSSRVVELGLGEILDPLIDSNLEVASIRVKTGDRIPLDLVEKLAVIADETRGRVVIIQAPAPARETLEEWYQVLLVYQVKLLLEPTTPADARKTYQRLSTLLGGVVGLSQVQEYYPSTESFLRVLTPYLQLTHNVQLSNYRDGKPARLLSVGVYNNPMLLRELVHRNYRGFVTLCYERSESVTFEFLFKELRTVSSFIAALQEKI
ncbi:MAG: hypothetical protein QXX83_07590 [Thermofilum sp.]